MAVKEYIGEKYHDDARKILGVGSLTEEFKEVYDELLKCYHRVQSGPLPAGTVAMLGHLYQGEPVVAEKPKTKATK